jgi:hypothetical protein
LHEVAHPIPSSILMEWSLFVRYNVWTTLWLLNKFFNTCHTFVGSKRSPIVGIRLSLIVMIKIVRALSFLNHSKVTSFVCYTSATVAYCATTSSCTLATSSIAPSSRAMAYAWIMGCISIVVTWPIPLGKLIPIIIFISVVDEPWLQNIVIAYSFKLVPLRHGKLTFIHDFETSDYLCSLLSIYH